MQKKEVFTSVFQLLVDYIVHHSFILFLQIDITSFSAKNNQTNTTF